MKSLVIFLFLVPTASCAQRTLIGNYHNYFGQSIEIKSDSTFHYKVFIDIYSSWTKGNWKMTGDTILFQMIPIWDTVSIDSRSIIKDTLILSLDSIPSRELRSVYFDTLRGYGQNYYTYPDKLVFRSGQLYKLNHEGKLDKRRVKGLWSQKRYPTWYKRSK